MSNKLKTPNSQRAAVLLVVLMVVTVLSIVVPAYVMWAIWDQKNLVRQQKAEEAKALAQAGLNRAILDLYLDDDSWLDGQISGYNVTLPNLGSPNAFYPLYNMTLPNATGSYNVSIGYIYNSSASEFYDKRMWARSTGTTNDTSASLQIEQFVNWYLIKNIGLNATNSTDDKSFYTNLRPAVGAVGANENIAVSAATLNENINITSGTFNLSGCYDPNFGFRSCMNYPSFIQGNVTVSGSADVKLSDLTIK